jgi:hypothetical protein
MEDAEVDFPGGRSGVPLGRGRGVIDVEVVEGADVGMDELVEMFEGVTVDGVSEEEDSFSAEEGEVGVGSTPQVESGSIEEVSLLRIFLFLIFMGGACMNGTMDECFSLGETQVDGHLPDGP